MAKVPLAMAPKPPPMLIRPTLIRVRPIISTTMPVTNGVIRRLTKGRMRDTPISTNEPAITTPKIAAITLSTGVPCLTISAPPAISGPTKLKLVPCTISKPAPNGPNRLHCTKVAIPEMTSDIDTIRLVSRAETPNAWQISRPGVTIGTMIASRCCSAASRPISSRGLSSRPSTSSLAGASAPRLCSCELIGEAAPEEKRSAFYGVKGDCGSGAHDGSKIGEHSGNNLTFRSAGAERVGYRIQACTYAQKSPPKRAFSTGSSNRYQSSRPMMPNSCSKLTNRL
ncbi:hypothetical protein D3C78_400170 [compost metagenome]